MLQVEKAQTTIAISKRNHDFLLEFGGKGQSFDDVITELRNKLEKKVVENQCDKGNDKRQSRTASRVSPSVKQSMIVDVPTT